MSGHASSGIKSELSGVNRIDTATGAASPHPVRAQTDAQHDPGTLLPDPIAGDDAEEEYGYEAFVTTNDMATLQDPAGTTTEAQLFLHNIHGPKGLTRRTWFACSHCEVAGQNVRLCREFCFHYWHVL